MKHLSLILLVFMSMSAVALERVALVIGNSDYQVKPLVHPVNDARDMARVLGELGFDVTLMVNAEQDAMESAIEVFGNKLGENTVGLFYFSGHGSQYDGENYLIPIKSINKISAAKHLRYKAVPAGYVLGMMQDNGLNIVILDACRNNPFKGFSKSLGRGLAQMGSAEGTLIAYATAPGTVALTGETWEQNSVYTKHLLKFMQQPNLSIESLLKKVRRAVIQETRNLRTVQRPWYEASISDEFYFVEDFQKPYSPPVKIPSPPIAKVLVAGEVFQDRLKDGGLGPEMVIIPKGRFQMGDIQGGGYYNEEPVHWVNINYQFAMGKYEVTFVEYDKFAEATGRKKPDDKGWGRGNRPVNVSWDDANAYTKWLSKQIGKQYRLPSEAEWEYAARAGTKTKYWWGNTAFHEHANYGKDECCGGLEKGKDKWEYTSPVGSFRANQFGLYDTVGNVWEWCADGWYDNKEGWDDNYKNAPTDGSVWKKGNKYKMLRGGSWNNNSFSIRATLRVRGDPVSSTGGFRLVGIVVQTFDKSQNNVIADKNNECKAWNPYTSINEIFIWSGQCVNGIAHGKGTLKLYEDGVEKIKYIGKIKDGKYHGYGKKYSYDEFIYEGNWKNGKLNGKGKYTCGDSCLYKGNFVDDIMTGKGVFTWRGTHYEGEFQNGKMNGKGVFTWANNQRYEGEFQSGKISGKGIFTWPDGQRYKGEFRNGKKNGQGIMTYPNGQSYEGEWKDNEMNGRGMMIWSDDTRYVGEWKNDKADGQGIITYPNGGTYRGNWKNGIKEGKLEEVYVTQPFKP